MTKFVMAEMSSREFREALRETDTALLPVASTEVLGDQGPLGADTFVAEAVARKVAERTACLVAPTIPVGDASELRFWPGTIWIDGEVLGRLYLEICNSLVSHGIRRILFLNAHLGNLRSVDYCGRALRRRGVLAAQADWWRVAFACGEDLVESIESPKGHGGEILASVVLAASPVPVDFAAVPAEAPKKAARFHAKGSSVGGGPFYTYPDFRDFTASGGWGDPAKGTAEKGRIIIDRGVERIAAFVVELKSQPLPETRPDF
jgi:creatinine amidohydrolase